MIRFRSPRLLRMSSGSLSIQLTDEGTWESFPGFAEVLVEQIGAVVTEKIDGPDLRLWNLLVSSKPIRLVYDDYPNGVSLEPIGVGADQVIQGLFETFDSQRHEDGI